MSRFLQMQGLQKFAAIHASVFNHFNQDRNFDRRSNFEESRTATLAEWRRLCAS